MFPGRDLNLPNDSDPSKLTAEPLIYSINPDELSGKNIKLAASDTSSETAQLYNRPAFNSASKERNNPPAEREQSLIDFGVHYLSAGAAAYGTSLAGSWAIRKYKIGDAGQEVLNRYGYNLGTWGKGTDREGQPYRIEDITGAIDPVSNPDHPHKPMTADEFARSIGSFDERASKVGLAPQHILEQRYNSGEPYGKSGTTQAYRKDYIEQVHGGQTPAPKPLFAHLREVSGEYLSAPEGPKKAALKQELEHAYAELQRRMLADPEYAVQPNGGKPPSTFSLRSLTQQPTDYRQLRELQSTWYRFAHSSDFVNGSYNWRLGLRRFAAGAGTQGTIDLFGNMGWQNRTLGAAADSWALAGYSGARDGTDTHTFTGTQTAPDTVLPKPRRGALWSSLFVAGTLTGVSLLERQLGIGNHDSSAILPPAVRPSETQAIFTGIGVGYPSRRGIWRAITIGTWSAVGWALGKL